MKQSSKITLLAPLFLSFGLQSDLPSPTQVIIKTYVKHEHENQFSKNVVVLNQGEASIVLLEEGNTSEKPGLIFETSVENIDHSSLTSNEKKMLVGWLLDKMYEHKISVDCCTFIDKHTACERKLDGYFVCHPRVSKERVATLREEGKTRQ